ncbi:MAG: DNA mismatch repair protein MutS [Clostridia bacterium]|nr:DNA mismatch repair protein MutS [Clostridia bacterium]
MALSPMMTQYLEVKEQYPDALVFFRLGDFYEMFFEDAKTASKELELTLTGRDCGLEQRAPMCGIPYHSADNYIGRLVNKGYKVVICEQMEDPKQAKGIVKRDVVRIVTPGTVTDNTQLDEKENNYICALYFTKEQWALCVADISTGDLSATAVSAGQTQRLISELALYAPKEVIANCAVEGELLDYLKNRLQAKLYDNMPQFEQQSAIAAFTRSLGSPAGYPEEQYPILLTVGALISYVSGALKSEKFSAKSLNVYGDGQYLFLDSNTRRNLELCRTMHQQEKKGSLLWVLDYTCTAMGARLLRQYVEQPLVNQRKILYRQSAVAELAEQFLLRSELKAQLQPVLDIERLMTKVVYGSAGGKDLRAIANTIAVLPGVRALLQSCQSDALRDLYNRRDELADLYTLLNSAIKEEPPFSVREGGFVEDGYNQDVDKLREIMDNAGGYLKKIENRERERLGVKNLKVGYNRVFGYYIEISKVANEGLTLPEDYVRRQTLTTGERYITEELKNLESTILGAGDKDAALEYEIFLMLCKKLTDNMERIRKSASCIAELDVYLSLAFCAVENGYVCPEITYDDVIKITEGRHPVVEKYVKDGAFVPNDTMLDTGHNRLMMITGPNMAGKSTYMRQVALITVMAQIGSFVPASEARIGIVDKLFTRVGASDDLASGTSTFMLEMNEVASILKNATKRSLIIYDEIGRGTSTYDGMSIAKAVAEYTAGKKLGAKALFATHYHELTEMADGKNGIVNYHIAAKKKGDTLVFLRKILPGAADDSYGIEVAKLAGVPNEVIKIARETLKTLEEKGVAQPRAPKIEEEDNMTIDSYLEKSVCEKLRNTQMDMITPLEAMTLLYELKKSLS